MLISLFVIYVRRKENPKREELVRGEKKKERNSK